MGLLPWTIVVLETFLLHCTRVVREDSFYSWQENAASILKNVTEDGSRRLTVLGGPEADESLTVKLSFMAQTLRKGQSDMSNSLRLRKNRLAQRFAVQVPVQIEIPGSNQAIACSTRDVSHQGIFLYTDHPLPENAPIRFTMKLKATNAPKGEVKVLCCGTVVRIESSEAGDIGMAATIDSYQFMYQKGGKA